MVRRHLGGLAPASDQDRYQQLRRIGRVQVGTHTYGIPDIRTFNYDDTRLVIGSYTSIANGATFLLGGNHPLNFVTTFPLRLEFDIDSAGGDEYPCSKGDIHVGSDVWIGHGALILSGVNIGDGAAIAANSVVVSDVPPYAIVAGNPAVMKRFRFSEMQRQELTQIAWWEWPEERVRRGIDLLSGPDIDGFIDWARH